MDYKKLQGYILVAIGLIILFFNAASYIFRWDMARPALTVIGLILAMAGLRLLKNTNN